MNAIATVETPLPVNIEAERLREVLRYEPDTGRFFWRVPLSSRAKVGAEAGSKSCGYRQIKIDGKVYWAHRLAWFYMTGDWPDVEIDHANLDRSDNRWANLRLASRGQNIANYPILRTNRCGFKGASEDRRRKVWRARIRIAGRTHWLGTFDSPEKAHAAYMAAARELHGDFARAR